MSESNSTPKGMQISAEMLKQRIIQVKAEKKKNEIEKERKRCEEAIALAKQYMYDNGVASCLICDLGIWKNPHRAYPSDKQLELWWEIVKDDPNCQGFEISAGSEYGKACFKLKEFM